MKNKPSPRKTYVREAVIEFIDESNVGWDFVYGMVYAEKLYREKNWK